MTNNISFAGDNKNRGFTLIEMLLVMVIISMIIVMGIRFVQQQAFNTRVDRTTMQMQQILNASLSYYVTNGAWPASVAKLQTDGYLPSSPSPLMSPWGTEYQLKVGPRPNPVNPLDPVQGPNPLIYVFVSVSAGSLSTSAAQIISGNLPLSYITSDADPLTVTPCAIDATSCMAVSSVTIPGQNLNNANAVTYAGLYHNGACVPVPQCPVDTKTGKTMIPQIMVVPASVSGVNDTNSTNVYPISSFTAYATDPVNFNGSTGPAVCSTNTSTDTKCYADETGGDLLPTNVSYWRVCLEVVTEKGTVNWTQPPKNWGEYATVMAITRCGIQGEPSGSGFDVFTQ